MDLFEYCWVSSIKSTAWYNDFNEVSELFTGAPRTSTTDSIRIRPPGAGTANRPDVLHRISLCVVCTLSNLEKIGQTDSQPSARWLFYTEKLLQTGRHPSAFRLGLARHRSLSPVGWRNILAHSPSKCTRRWAGG